MVLFSGTHWVVKGVIIIVVVNKMLVFRSFLFFKVSSFVIVRIIFKIDHKTHPLCFIPLCSTFSTGLNVFFILVFPAILKCFLTSFWLLSLIVKTLCTIEFVSNYLLSIKSFILWRKKFQFVNLNWEIHPCRHQKYA